jgi:hypothetical protein
VTFLVSAGPSYEGPVVYVIQAGYCGPVKIGTTSSSRLLKRLAQLQTANADRLHVLRTYVGGVGLERELHRRFAASRLAGEWFSFSDEIRALVVDPPNFPELVVIRGKVVSRNGVAV